MLDRETINRIATEVATANLSSQNFTSVVSSTAVDSEGQEALRITITIPPGAESKIEGDATLNTLVQIRGRLRDEGEERFPIIDYTYGEPA